MASFSLTHSLARAFGCCFANRCMDSCCSLWQILLSYIFSHWPELLDNCGSLWQIFTHSLTHSLTRSFGCCFANMCMDNCCSLWQIFTLLHTLSLTRAFGQLLLTLADFHPLTHWPDLLAAALRTCVWTIVAHFGRFSLSHSLIHWPELLDNCCWLWQIFTHSFAHSFT